MPPSSNMPLPPTSMAELKSTETVDPFHRASTRSVPTSISPPVSTDTIPASPPAPWALPPMSKLPPIDAEALFSTVNVPLPASPTRTEFSATSFESAPASVSVPVAPASWPMSAE
jgi:hypothetical protein